MGKCKGAGCVYHTTSPGTRANLGLGQTFCSVCREPDREELQDLESHATRGLVRTLRKLEKPYRMMAMKRFQGVQGLAEHLRERMSQDDGELGGVDDAGEATVVRPTKPSQNSADAVDETIDEQERDKASSPGGTASSNATGMSGDIAVHPTLPKEHIDQGDFQWCTYCALATGVAGALFGKFGFSVEAQTILTTWIVSQIPQKSAWPDEAAQSASPFRWKRKRHIYDVVVRAPMLLDFRACAKQMWESWGFRHVIIVARFLDNSGCEYTHSLVDCRWCSQGCSLMCLNSWGEENNDAVFVTKDNFVRAYAVDVDIARAHTAQGKWTVPCTIPQANSFWMM